MIVTVFSIHKKLYIFFDSATGHKMRCNCRQFYFFLKMFISEKNRNKSFICSSDVCSTAPKQVQRKSAKYVALMSQVLKV